eukprot:11162498-Alexandrium_andersonii.AAC.1
MGGDGREMGNTSRCFGLIQILVRDERKQFLEPPWGGYRTPGPPRLAPAARAASPGGYRPPDPPDWRRRLG